MGETLFREVSLSTRLMSAYLDYDQGRDYLKTTVVPLLNEISSSEHVLEVNPEAVDRHTNVQANLDKILAISQKFFDQVISSPNRFP